jgi:hypothetical protein
VIELITEPTIISGLPRCHPAQGRIPEHPHFEERIKDNGRRLKRADGDEGANRFRSLKESRMLESCELVSESRNGTKEVRRSRLICQ